MKSQQNRIELVTRPGEEQDNEDVVMTDQDNNNVTTIKIHVKLTTGQNITLDASPSDTVERVKTLIQAREQIPHHDQSLKCGRKSLEYGKTLSEYNIKNDSTLLLNPTRRSRRSTRSLFYEQMSYCNFYGKSK